MAFRSIVLLLGLVMAGLPWPGHAQTVLVDASLIHGVSGLAPSVSCTQTGGAFSGAGWSVTAEDSQLWFDLGGEVDHGRLTVKLRSFDPVHNMHWGTCEAAVHLIALYEGSACGLWPAAHACETMFAVQSTGEGSFRDARMLLKWMSAGWSCDDCDGEDADCSGYDWSEDYAWDPQTEVWVTLDWDASGISMEVSEAGANASQAVGSWVWPAHLDHAEPRIGYLTLGTDNSTGMGWLGEVTFADLQVQDLDLPSDDDDAGDDDAGDDDAGDDDAGDDDSATAGDDDDAAADDDGEDQPADGDDPRSCSCSSARGMSGTGGAMALLAFATLAAAVRRRHRGRRFGIGDRVAGKVARAVGARCVRRDVPPSPAPDGR